MSEIDSKKFALFLLLYDLFKTTVLTFLFVNVFCNIEYRVVVWNISEQNTLKGLIKLWGELIGKYVVYECSWRISDSSRTGN